MNWLKLLATSLRIIRIEEWLQQVTIVGGCFLILLAISPVPALYLWLIPVLLVYTTSLAIYGYSLNTLCDLDQDSRAGKRIDAQAVSPWALKCVIAASIMVALASLLLLAHVPAILLGLLNVLLVTGYSSPPIRLKERGLAGVVSGSLAQRVIPFLVTAIMVRPMPPEAWFIALWLALLGGQLMLVHQLEDYGNDGVAGVRTWTQSLGQERVLQSILVLAALSVVVPILALILFAHPAGVALCSMLLLLCARSMLWTGSVVLAHRRELAFTSSESRLALAAIGEKEDLESHLEMSKAFLLKRVRSGELCTRAPEGNPHKHWDWKGEPYLALNAVIALGEDLTGGDRKDLAAGISALQKQGAWDYTNGGRGPDSDTTASAIRALDRLGEEIGVSGLDLFFNEQTGLYNTFLRAGQYGGLQLPPQSKDGHFGAHPCVLPNIWLLLRERGSLQTLPSPTLREMQNDDGLWACYFYSSPYYSTRLFCELLSGFGDTYAGLLEPTVRALLECDLPRSPTQQAEMAIALHHLRGMFKARESEIRERVALLVRSLLRTQKQDGSWEGETIWTFVHREHAQDVEGVDCMRVHSTSLASQALEMFHRHRHMNQTSHGVRWSNASGPSQGVVAKV